MPSPVDYQLSLLPERKLNLRALACSYGSIATVVAFLLGFGVLFPQQMQIARNYVVTEIVPRPDLEPKPVEIVKAPVVKAHLLPPPPIENPKLVVPHEVHIEKPKVQEIEVPKVALNTAVPSVLKEETPKPVQIVHTGDFGSSATPTLTASAQKVQTGGFGDPNGLTGPSKPARLIAASTGAFDLPEGAGNGIGTGGAKGMKGVVASAGFGSGMAQSAQSAPRVAQSAGFASTQLASLPKNRTNMTGPENAPVEILFKPNPVYTDEARQLQLQGEVLLEVAFGADGKLHVNKVVRGLGHGLDEAATVAANKMRFKPALRDGEPIDSTAVVHVTFQLAM